MMSKVASMSPEGIEWISSSLGNMARERKLPVGSSARMEKLLGFNPISHASPTEYSDLNELKEEDVWEDDFSMAELKRDESLSPAMRDKFDLLDTTRAVSTHRRWPGLERDSGFSLAFESGRTRGLSAFSPLNRGAGNLSPLNRGAGSLSGHGSSREGTPGRLTSTSRMIPQTSGSPDYGRRAVPQSAPVKVPDWSKVVGMEQKVRERNFLAEEDDDDVEDRLPPHELVAREYARSQMTTSSVIEGAGRTLKGRDMSKVRNAVWSQTGFFG